MKDNFKWMDEATELFKLVTELGPEKQIQTCGLLNPPSDNSIFAYNLPALHIIMRVSCNSSVNYEFFACIRSIDDSGVSIFGPSETYEKAKDRYDKFVEYIKTGLSFSYLCPNKKELEAVCQRIGAAANYW